MGVRMLRSSVVVLSFLVASFPANAAEPAREACPAIDPPAPAAPGVRLFVDPVTGKRRAPTALELRQIAEERRRARRAKVSALVLETHAGGMKSVDLGTAFLMEVVLETGPDGESRARCAPESGRTAAASGVPAGEMEP
ncbi:MAG: hypothetical protein WD451_00045 [Thermoanaerobaculia bacterium]